MIEGAKLVPHDLGGKVVKGRMVSASCLLGRLSLDVGRHTVRKPLHIEGVHGVSQLRPPADKPASTAWRVSGEAL